MLVFSRLTLPDFASMSRAIAREAPFAIRRILSGRQKIRRVQIIWLALLLQVDSNLALAESPLNFHGQNIEVIVPYMPGGGTDTWVRTVAPHLSNHLPGKPEIVVVNAPGGNATTAANVYAEEAQPDGRSVLVTASSNQLSYLLGDSRVRYDFGQWRALLAYRAGAIVYTGKDMGVENIQQFLKKPNKHVVMASMGVTSDDLFVLMAFDMLDVNVSSIFGTRGRGRARALFERGEANIDFQTTAAYMAYVKPKESSGEIVPLFTLGSFDDALTYVRDPMFPELPNLAEVYEYVHGKPPEGEAWDAWISLYRAGYGSLKSLVIPKDTPDSIVAAYDEATLRMINDPEFIASVSDNLGHRSMLNGADASELLRLRTTLPDETRRWIVSWILERYGIRL